jgi:hypothetical protein
VVTVFRTLCLAVVATTPAIGAEEGLVAHYPCDEGSGSILGDVSGHGNHGAISGAAFAPFGDGFALRLDGVDDFATCGSEGAFSLQDAVTVEAWVYPEGVPAKGEAGIAGKSYSSFVLTYYADGQCWWYISGGGNNCKAPLTVNQWQHVAGTFDGRMLRLYIDGKLAGSHVSTADRIGEGKTFFLGRSDGDVEFTKNAHFHGMIDEVRVYDRALSADEVLTHFRTTHLTNTLSLTWRAYPLAGELVVELGTRGLGELPPDASATIGLRRPARERLLARTEVRPLLSWGAAQCRLSVVDLAPGEYEIVARAQTADKGAIGEPATSRVTWPEKPSWGGQAAKMKVLNNLVTELLSIRPGADARAIQFTNPRDGWVIFASSADVKGDGETSLRLAAPAEPRDLTVHRAGGEPTQEAMRWLPSGEHELHIEGSGKARLTRLVVRAVPELIFAKFGANPHVSEYGEYDWGFLKRHVLPHLNTMVGTGAEAQRPFAEEWKRAGKRWIVECGVPGLREESVTADEAERYWTQNPGLSHPLCDGIIADEFWSSDTPRYHAWTEAVRRIAADPNYSAKTFYPYCGPMFGAELSRTFMETVLGAGYRFALERYLPEQRSEAAARAYLDTALRQQVAQWRESLPGSERQMAICFGYFSAPPESLDVDPSVDHKVYLDMQFHLVANDPTFWGLGGLMTYLCSYADEETVRWAGKLFRHYGIEGRTDRLTADPYELPHLANGDFEEGLTGWQVSAAEEGSVEARSMEGYSWLQGRYPRTSQGNTFLWMKRSAEKPNVVSQTVRALEPGRLYTLRAYIGDYQDLSVKQTHAVSIDLQGVEAVPDRAFRHVFANCYSHHHGPYDQDHKAWMNYDWRVFRAKAPEAELVISDWASPDDPVGPIGQETMVNFVQIQPYDAP